MLNYVILLLLFFIYLCIDFLESTNNLEDFISMDPERGVGEVLSLKQFLERFL